ncbi:MAG: hypothetical protein Q9210_006004 [Variospora velana]
MLVPPPYKPPLVTVQSPIPPERANGASKSIPLVSEQRDNAAMDIGHGYAVTSPDTAVPPVANSVIKPVVHPHSAFRPGYHTDVSESRTGSGILPIARLEATVPTVDDRKSPFSTPPSSDENRDTDVPDRKTPMKILHPPGPTHMMKTPKTAEFPAHPSPSKSQNKRQSKTQGNPFVNTALVDHPSNSRPRPELPPRPETTSGSLSLAVNHAPMSGLPTTFDKANIRHALKRGTLIQDLWKWLAVQPKSCVFMFSPKNYIR